MSRKEVFSMFKNFISVYANDMKEFITLKQQFGYKYRNGIYVLLKIDKLAFKLNIKSSGITRELAEKWLTLCPNEKLCSKIQRSNFLIHFSNFLNDKGIDSYVPRYHFKKREARFIPYIFTNSEINLIFKASDEMTLPCRALMSTCIFSIPCLLRVLYSTGIRIGEALALKDSDINLTDSYMKINDSKNGEERTIPISESLKEVCSTYLLYRKLLPVQNPNGHFFIKLSGEKCTYQGTLYWFKKCLSKSGIKSLNNRIRLHDIRHTFAVTSLASMAQEGVDLYASLPILSVYMGHKSIDSTNYYVRMTSAIFPDLLKKVEFVSLNVFPKIIDYENN